MKRALLRSLVGLFVACVGAQALLMDTTRAQSRPNVNVLPAYINPADPDAYLKGDQYMQRQVEPTYMVSTRNPDHHIVFFNDYRAVDAVVQDTGVGEGRGIIQAAADLFRRLFVGPKTPQPTIRAAAEAFVGYSITYDNGSTWTGGMLPGAPFDASPASLASPIHGMEAATDAVGSSAPCGRFYVGFIAFTRGGPSALAVATFEDKNNTDGGHDIQYVKTTVVERGAASAIGKFLDKPALIVDPARSGGGDSCAHTVYLAYSAFDGQENNGKFRSKIMVTRSTDGGETWDSSNKISEPYAHNQSAAMAIDPRANGGGAITVMWRSFDPQGMLAATSTNGGTSFGRPVLLNNTPIQPFDQPTLPSPGGGLPVSEGFAFRSNALPTIAAAGDGTLYAAWQERVSLEGCSSTPQGANCGRPSANGTPRIVLMRSRNAGATWTDAFGDPGARRAVDFGDRCENTVQPGLGPVVCRPSFAQVMPRLAAGGGRLMLLYYEARAGLTGPFPGFVAGLDRSMDVRTTRLDPATGQLAGTTQVSSYDVSASADMLNGGGYEDLVQNSPGAPAIGWTGKPTSASGSSPFLGDYIDLVPAVQFVRSATGRWRWASQPGDVPDRRFHAAFADHRNLIAPSFPGGLPEELRYQFYSPPHLGGSCINPGSRNADIMSAEIEADLVAGAPVTFRELENITRAFPIYVSNNTLEHRFYRLTISEGASFSSFVHDLAQPQDVDSMEVELLPNASSTNVVYADVVAGATARVRVDVAQLTCLTGTPGCTSQVIAVADGGQSASVTFNVDPSNPLVKNPLVKNEETHNPLVKNAEVTYPLVKNPLVKNPSTQNPLVKNAFVVNPLVKNPEVTNPLVKNQTVYDMIDTTWSTTNDGTVSSAYVPIINIDNYEQLKDSYLFQLFVFRVSTRAGVGPECQPVAIPYDQLITTVPNPLVKNPLVKNPLVKNPLVKNVEVTNSTFFVSPSESANQSASASFTPSGIRLAAFKTAQLGPAQPIVAPRAPDEVFITLRAYQIVPAPPVLFNPEVTPPGLAVYPKSPNIVKNGDGTITETPPEDLVSFSAPDLRLAAAPAASAATVAPGGTVQFPVGGATVQNGGQIPAAPADGAARYRIYLSPDSTPGNGDIIVDQGSLPGPIAPGAGVGIPQQAVHVSPYVLPGVYHLIIVIDDQQEVSESDEDNNIVDVPITVGAPASGFLSFVTEPSDGTAGQPIAPSVQVLARDATAAVLPGVNIDLTFVNNPVGSTLSHGTATTNTVGVATFPLLSIAQAGSNFSLQATAGGGLAQATSQFFSISGASPGGVCGVPSFAVSQLSDHHVSTDPGAVVVADFNRDGRPDVATANRASGNVAIVMATAAAGFADPVYYAVGANPAGLVAGDFNVDGSPDLAVAVAGTSSIAILLNDGSGGFTTGTPISLAGSPTAVAKGDFNRDGRLDLVAVYQDASLQSIAAVARGSVPGTFSAPTTFFLRAGSPQPSAVAVGDIDGDNILDVLVAEKAADTITFLPGTGGGSFSSPVDLLTDDSPVALAIGDFNGDGINDVVVGHADDPTISVLRGQDDAPPVLAATLFVSSGVRGVVTADIDGDGFLDVASVHAEGFDAFLGNGDLGFGSAHHVDPNFEPRAIAAADFAVQDGKVDFVVANGSPADAVTFLKNSCTAGPRELVVTNTNDSGAGSLRAAMTAAAANSGFTDTVRFAIPGAGPFTITPDTALPAVSDPVTIDARTQPGYSGSPLVRVDGTTVGGGGVGFDVTATAAGSSFYGLSMTGWAAHAIGLTSNNNIVQANYLGLTPAGAGAGNGGGVYVLDGSGNLIGGVAASLRNVIAANGHGVFIDGTSTANTVIGNYIGLRPDGDTVVANGGAGVRIEGSVGGNDVGQNGGGNVIAGNNSAGVFILGSPNNRVVGNYIGVNAAGTAARGNAGGGIFVQASNTTIGGGNAGDGNVISGNAFNGIQLNGASTTGNVIKGNLIGTNATGTAAVGNAANGVFAAGAGNVQIGGANAGDRNVISGNLVGIHLDGNSNRVQGNYIGTTANGLNAIPNNTGVWVTDSTSNLVGGINAGEGNVISGNSGAGVLIGFESGATATSNTVFGNYIGTDKNGVGSVANNDGVQIDRVSGNQIGSTGPGGGNVISGNNRHGVVVSGLGAALASANIVRGNKIGVQADGTSRLSNHGFGVLVHPSVNGLEVAFNTIWYNDFSGVGVANATAPDVDSTGVDLNGSSIDMNGSLGVDLGIDGVTANDANDVDAGPNGQRNYPVLTSAIQTGSQIAISGTLNSTPSTAFAIVFYNSPVCNADQSGSPSGVTQGEGRTVIGGGVYITDAAGNLSFTQPITLAPLALGSAITANATLAVGEHSTSEFSNCVSVTGSFDPSAVININDAGPGSLREAITFNIPGSNRRIRLNTALPAMSDPVFIDGESQPGYTTDPLVTVDGSSATRNRKTLETPSVLRIDAPARVDRQRILAGRRP
jgi:hypothetical protein